MKNNFQRKGSASNAHAGREFEQQAKVLLGKKGLALYPNFHVEIGVAQQKKPHAFDLGSNQPPVVVECKSNSWRKGKDVPSAKLTVWNEAMYYFHCTPKKYRKILFVLRSVRKKSGETLASYYVRNFGHLIPNDVEIWEYDPDSGEVTTY